ncbi:LysR family transcriptional regulator [Bacterioplanoides sp. SCSIO 12839]|uniref:LysR family transcriptional regulator n=1 Tax=Bacterioplanoides sp. SCSIO 12839 TaxID=2829569 RepID=UPI0021061BC5|nr:LysR family transcriptional regulator [Bacterioplanoides sp. SCSIO 12839]UTW48687.1 LysR family transcriptional regulator [Bacterioplanoides sp. SCSIO 12839]
MPLTVQRLVNRLSLRQLQLFQAVNDQGGYGKAAELLGLTQPAVSAQVKQLEEALGQKLFEYVGRKLYRTEAGDIVAHSVSEVFEELRNMQANLHALEGNISGDLRIAAVNTAQFVVPYLLQPFLAQHTNVATQVHVVNRHNAIERLKDNRDDLVIMGMVPSERPFISMPFMDNELVPVWRTDHPLAQQIKKTGKALTAQEFLDLPQLVREQGSGTRLALEIHCQQNKLSFKPYMELGSSDALKHAILAGLGVSVVPKLGMQAELELGQLEVVPVDGFPLIRSWCLVYPSAKQPSPATQAFINYVQENEKSLAELLSVKSQNGQ